MVHGRKYLKPSERGGILFDHAPCENPRWLLAVAIFISKGEHAASRIVVKMTSIIEFLFLFGLITALILYSRKTGTPLKARRIKDVSAGRHCFKGRLLNRQLQAAVLNVHSYFVREKGNNGPLLRVQQVL